VVVKLAPVAGQRLNEAQFSFSCFAAPTALLMATFGASILKGQARSAAYRAALEWLQLAMAALHERRQRERQAEVSARRLRLRLRRGPTLH
jgi:hypothetical protein